MGEREIERETNPIFCPSADHLAIPFAFNGEEWLFGFRSKGLGPDLILLAPVEGLREKVHFCTVACLRTGY